MRRYELGINMNYCSHWGFCEAIRELYQNIKDEEIEHPDHKLFFEYQDGKLVFGNCGSSLSASSLLLGSTTKADKDELIGRFGEGYKVAAVILLRLGKRFTIHNSLKGEDWLFHTVKSRRYGTEIPVVDVDRSFFKPKKGQTLVFEVEGVTEEDYLSLKDVILPINDDLGETKSTDLGSLLLDAKYKGKVYVAGLYICSNSNLKFGYDFIPNLVKLDRDRGLIDSFELSWSTSRLLACIEDIDFLYEYRGSFDARFLSTVGYSPVLGGRIYSSFKKDYGDDAIPTTDTDSFNDLKKRGYNAVMVSRSDYDFITQNKEYVPPKSGKESLQERFEQWLLGVEHKLSEAELQEIKDIFESI